MNNAHRSPAVEISAVSTKDAQKILTTCVERLGDIILGKHTEIKLALTCLLAQGHLLIEDIPGVGKTTLAQSLALVLGLDYHRIQFTSDMLPADILGVSIFDTHTQSFRFHPGPVFCNVILADEINRATPKAQSALLEAMEERQISIEGQTRDLPLPFFVIATQNPIHQVGTFPLPESQLDRFLMRISLGYPEKSAERLLITGEDRRQLLKELQTIISPSRLMQLQQQAAKIFTSEDLLDYLQAIIEHTRYSSLYTAGLSPRATLALVRAAQAWALLHGRDHVIPEDIQATVPAIVSHRLRLRADTASENKRAIYQPLLELPIP